MATTQSVLKPKIKAGKKASTPVSLQDPQVQASLEELTQKIQQKAYELYEQRGCAPGHECQDWLEAERLISTEYKKSSTQK